jgi:hypothetical protein
LTTAQYASACSKPSQRSPFSHTVQGCRPAATTVTGRLGQISGRAAGGDRLAGTQMSRICAPAEICVSAPASAQNGGYLRGDGMERMSQRVGGMATQPCEDNGDGVRSAAQASMNGSSYRRALSVPAT